ncbi:phosphopantetheine-binding protein [Metamycoplasma neophronis]|uniref:Acyl carrier protein n=1 Tax=Metamycoplasma neophronis TaxID=872983 RepID=A0ABY2Z033_9BACT|nr:phosphopantetheine-binding protein [Metamycoplasma neophronis]TPR54099.1 acyl carrier protein [Metamycoplasma neophronis]
MNAQEIIFKLLKCLTKTKFNLESNIKDLNIDSLDLVVLITDMEDKYNISITDEELMKLKTVGDIVNLLESKLEK